MLKRKLSRSLAEQVLDEKLEILRRRDHTKSSTDVKNIHSAHVAAFPYLLEICLAVEKASCQQLNNTPSLDAEVKTAEESGDYDYAQLQSENISQATLHAAYIGPVRVSSLPGPKTQGVVADRDIYKGELLCTSVPSIVVSNLVSVDEPTDLLFSDLSRAEMTAKLICLAEVTPSVRTTLKSFEFAEKDDIAHDNLTGLCEAVISKYTWAIDHPSTNPQGQKFKGKYTKVAGHAFTVSGYAGKFNHSCVPNATMVSYGAVQFFRASVAIPKDTEVCVSYGFDPLDPVHKRRDKLRAHAGFECCCPLCLYQLHHVVTPNEKAHRHESFDDLLHDVLSGTDLESCFDQSFALSTEAVDALCVEALETTAKLLLGPGEPSYPTRLLDFDVLQVLAMQGRLQATMERDTGLDHARPQLVRQCVLLGIMLLTLELPRSPDIGISFGDLIRTNVQRVAKQIEIIDALRGDEACFDPAWWLEQSLQYTDTF